MENIPKQKLVVIVGPTASGKTSLSIEIAKRFEGEVISADSRQVYRGLDIGSGKVTPGEMDGVPHHLLDIADPKEIYTAADFVRDGKSVIQDIVARGKLPIVVGGTFFYIDMLLGRMNAPEVAPNLPLRAKLEVLSTETLHEILAEKDPERAKTIDKDNPVRLVRALEIVEALGKVPETQMDERYEVFMVGIDIEKDTLHKNIHERLLTRIDAGMIEETAHLHESGVSWDRLESFGLEYRYTAKFLRGELTKEEMLDVLETKIRQFAKRQKTWLRRDNTIAWFKPGETDKVFEKVAAFL